MKKKIVMIAICAITFCLVGCNSEKDEKREPVKVKVMEVSPSAAVSSTEYSGTIEENSGTSVSFATAGTVRRVYVNEGQSVTRGQVLAEIDPTTLQQAHNATLSLLNQAKDAYARMKKLHDANSLSEIQWVDVQSKLEQAQSSEQIASRALKDYRIVSPVSGVIANKTLEVGQNVLPSVSVLKVVNIDKVKVNISVPENEISRIEKGEVVNITVEALGGEQFTGVITEKDVMANALSRTYNIKVTVNNSSHRLMPGMICTACIGTQNRESVISLPLSAVQLSDKNFYFVWVVQQARAKKKYVDVGSVTSEGVVVNSGLAAGDKVIIEGQQKVSENMEVRQ